MRYAHFNPGADFTREFDTIARGVNKFVSELEKGIRFEVGSFTPRIDIAEDAANYFVFAELPGVAKEDLKISVSEEKVLMIRGEKKAQPEVEGRRFLRTESVSGAFTREIQLRDDVQIENIQAKYENGILHLTIPKAEPAKPKEVHINID